MNVVEEAGQLSRTYRSEKNLSKPKIAIIAASLDIVGGHGTQAQILIRELQREGYEVQFVPINPRFPKALQWLRDYRYARTLLNQLLYLSSLAPLRRFDVVHIFSASYWSFVLAPLPAILAARGFGKRAVLHYHSGEAEDHLANWGRLVHPWLRLVDRIVVPSEYLRRIFEAHGYQTSVINNVVDTSVFRYRERKEPRPRLLSTRNLEPHYAVDNTLRAFSLLKSQYPEATLTLVGYGSEERRLRELSAAIVQEGVFFAGRVEPSAMPRFYEEADIFLNSAVIDNQPVSILEAFAAGIPVVSTPTGGIADMVREGETGLIVPPGDPAAMAGAVATLLEQPDRTLAMARRAKNEVEQYSWSQVRQCWALAYSEQAA